MCDEVVMIRVFMYFKEEVCVDYILIDIVGKNYCMLEIVEEMIEMMG